ncbi:MAG: DHH family phosphoesterase [Defluviitaleaceae bacterium]|nr:DHH family phosphoesterase [Defluviitaleaceae bacterium]
MKPNEWILNETDADLPLMARVLGIGETTARVMANRGIRTKNAALAFLAPDISRMRDFFLLKDAQKAIEVVSAAIRDEKKIVIYGDYDVDGIMSTVILYKTLHAAGANCEYYIPHRVDEGYGMNLQAVEKLAASGAGLIIAVDNGISAIEEIAAARALGIETVIIDHHEPPTDNPPNEPSHSLEAADKKPADILPDAAAIINPKQADCEFPFKEMCAAGLVFLFADAFASFHRERVSDATSPADTEFGLRDEALALAAIATLCDIVDLVDENRILVTAGLAALNANKLINPGIGSLITVRGYLQKPIDTFAVGFILGPCLNATGRLDSAELAVKLLLTPAEDTENRMKLAMNLTALNDARKNLTAECFDRAIKTVNEGAKEGVEGIEGIREESVIILTDPLAHESVAGIVAGRIRDATCRPTILLTKGNSMFKGSARSVEGYNIFEALHRHRHLFHRFGGHAMAAGLTLAEENIEILRHVLNDECELGDEDFRQKFLYDGEILPDEITLELSDEFARLAPFGRANREPLFVARGLYAQSVRIINEKKTLIFTFVCNNGKRLKGIAFGLNEKYAEIYAAAGANKTGGITLDALFHIETNVWNNVAGVQVRLRDFRVH